MASERLYDYGQADYILWLKFQQRKVEEKAPAFNNKNSLSKDSLLLGDF